MQEICLLKLHLYDKNNLQITKDKNRVSNQYTLFDSSLFRHFYCGPHIWDVYTSKRTLLEEK